MFEELGKAYGRNKKTSKQETGSVNTVVITSAKSN